MPTNAFKLNPALQEQWKSALSELASIRKASSPESVQNLVLQSARRFVKNVADITPPASGKADGAAKKAGENAIISDLLKLALPTQAPEVSRAQAREIFTSATEFVEVHARAFTKGDVNPRNRREKLLVERRDFDRIARQLMSRVGWLAAGLNAAAARLGFSLPAWIKRHGAKYGKIEVLATSAGLRVRILQDVPFVDGVRGYARKWNFALNKEITSIRKQTQAIFARKAARARARLARR
jgi:hypothetical protein